MSRNALGRRYGRSRKSNRRENMSQSYRVVAADPEVARKHLAPVYVYASSPEEAATKALGIILHEPVQVRSIGDAFQAYDRTGYPIGDTVRATLFRTHART